LIEPSGLNSVSFLVASNSSDVVFGGEVMPFAANMSLL